MPDTPSSSQSQRMPRRDRRRVLRAPSDPELTDRRAALANVIPRRAGVSWWLGLVLAAGLAALVTPAITAERWLLRFHAGQVTDQGVVIEPGTIAEKRAAPFTVRAPMFAGYDNLRVGGGVVVARGETASRDEATIADAIARTMPRGPVLYAAFFALIFVLAALFTHHMRRSTKGRLVRVQVVSLVVLVVLAVVVKLVLLSTALSALVVPVAVLALVPTLVLDRIVGLATGVLGALVVSLLTPFDVGLTILLLVQAATAGLVVAERPKQRWRAALGAGLVTTLCTGATYLLLTYLTTGYPPDLHDPWHSAWLAAAVGPALAAVLAVPLVPIYQLLVGEITRGKLFSLEDLDHSLLCQIAEKSPGTWQHSLMMANMAEIAANAIGASGRLVRVGAYFHDLGKSLSPKYFIENLEAGETSPHDQLPPHVSCDAIFAHVTEGIVSARKGGLHERIVDFMHMHHGDGVLEYFWAKCRDQGNPHDLTVEDFRYPGHPPQSRETAILAICDAVEAASRTLKKPDAAAIDALVQRIVYGKLHLGQLDESGLSMSDLRRISDSLRETIRHANHGRIEYPWQKAEQDASASATPYTSTSPRLDSLDGRPGRDLAPRAAVPPADSDVALAATADVKNPASEQRIPVAGSALPGDTSDAVRIGASTAGDAVKIRAGTARNTHASTPPAETAGDHVALPAARPAAGAIGDPAMRHAAEAPPAPEWAAAEPPHGTDRHASGLAPGREQHGRPATEPRGARPLREDSRAMAMLDAVPAPIREVPITIPGRAPGPRPPPRDVIAAPAFELSPPPDPIPAPPPAAPSFVRVPPPAALTFDHDPPSDVQTFDPEPPPAVPAFGHAAPPAAPAFVREPPPAALTFDPEPPPAEPAPGDELPPAAPTFGDDLPAATALTAPAISAPAITAPALGPEPASAARTRAATLPPAQARRPPTPPPPLASRRATGEPARTAGPPTPVDLDNAITNPPPMRRGPSGHPPVPSDPAQLAAELASTVSRASSGPFPMPRPPHSAAAKATRHADPDSAITNPPPLGAQPRTGPGHADLDNAITNPPPLGAQPRSTARRPDRENAIMKPPPPDREAAIASPPPAREAAQPADRDRASAEPASLDAPHTLEFVQPAGADPISLDAPRTTEVIHRADADLASLDAPETTEPAHSADAPPAPRTTDLVDSAITQPSMPAAPPEAEAATAEGVDSAITEPSLSSAPEARPATDLDPPAASPPAAAIHEAGPAARRTTGLADGDRRPQAVETLLGPGAAGEPITIRRSGAPAEPPPAARPGGSAEAARREDPEERPPTRLAALRLEDEARVTAARAATKPRRDDPRRAAAEHELDAGVTVPSLPILAVGDERRVDLPLRITPPAAAEPERKPGWASGLAARIDAALESDEWSRDTPVVAPTKAELRALLGQPDPTRQQPLDEIALLQRRAAEMKDAGASRRSAHPTAEVDPDDIEAAIELAPPARRPTNANALNMIKPKKSE